MNIKKIITFVFLPLLCLLPGIVKAEVTPTVTCDQNQVVAGDQVICDVTIVLNNEESVNLPVSINSNAASIFSNTPINGFYYSDAFILDDASDVNYDGISIGQLVLSTNDVGHDENVTISVGSSSYTFTVIHIKSSDARLSKLTIPGYPFSFNANTTSYDLNINQEIVSISAVAYSESAIVSGDLGNIKLNYGKNVLTITVAAEDGSQRVYTLNITRSDTRNNSNYLSSLSLSKGSLSPKFNKDTLKYTASVDYDVTSVTINATKANKTASFQSGNGPRTVNLNEGNNTFKIVVRAENGDLRTYEIVITRNSKNTQNNQTTPARLKGLSISPGGIAFSKDVYEYSVSVLNNVTKLDIVAEPEDSNSTVTINGNENLQVGDNKIRITVTNNNSSTQTYIINVKRLSVDESLSNNNYLESLSILNYDINFNKNKLQYTLKIRSEKELDIMTLSEDQNATIRIVGNENLKNNSQIKIIVIAEDLSERIYIINIKKSFNVLPILIVIMSILVVGGIVLLVILVLKNKDKFTSNKPPKEKKQKQKKSKVKIPKGIISADMLSNNR